MNVLEEKLQRQISSPLFGYVIKAMDEQTTTAQYLKQIEENGTLTSKSAKPRDKQSKTTRTKTPQLKLKSQF